VGTVAQHFLAGAYSAGRATEHTAVHSPGSGEHLADLPKATTADLDEAVAAARTAFADYARWSVYERADLCHRVAELIEQHADRLARLTSAEQGKPLAESRGDVEDSAALFSTSAEDAKRLYGETIPSTAREKRMLTHRRPVGVWAGITPWNFPLMIMCEFLGPALATGNAVVAKPPENTPLACLALGELLSEAGDDEILRMANESDLGLQAAVFTTSLSRAFRFAEELNAGSVVVNESTDYFEAAQPFGGASGTRTGWGRIGGLAQLADMTDLRTMIINLGS
jgi:acyl-CoA reductase-like NAD-dependent aldehyde dehydrogenase